MRVGGVSTCGTGYTSPTADLACVYLKKGGAVSTFIVCDDTSGGTRLLCLASALSEVVRTSCAGFNVYTISCLHLRFSGDYVEYKPDCVCCAKPNRKSKSSCRCWVTSGCHLKLKRKD